MMDKSAIAIMKQSRSAVCDDARKHGDVRTVALFSSTLIIELLRLSANPNCLETSAKRSANYCEKACNSYLS